MILLLKQSYHYLYKWAQIFRVQNHAIVNQTTEKELKLKKKNIF